MSFYFGEKDMRKKERITLRLDNILYNRLKSEEENISDNIRRILTKHYSLKDSGVQNDL